MLDRRRFLHACAAGTALVTLGRPRAGDAAGLLHAAAGLLIVPARPGEDLFAYLTRTAGGYDRARVAQLLGAANAYKEGDASIGVHAPDEAARRAARALIGATRLGDIDAYPLFDDQLTTLLQSSRDARSARRTAAWTMDELVAFLRVAHAEDVMAVAGGLSSEVIGCVVKLLDDAELIALSAKLFHPLPNSTVGAAGYFGARVQPNSPTDHPDDIRWQVFDAWAYGVGDVLLGTNPVSSEAASVAAVELTLQDVLQTFALEDVLPHCVLAHIDVQAEVERTAPGSTALWFQSLAGSDAANRTFDLTVDKMLAHADARTGRYGLYFETGQGADVTNGHGQGVDMVIHESRKYGFARALTARVANAQRRAGREAAPWVHVNDVAGFIGPEVFRSREQLVRCCLEDLAMGKLHGLTIGLDVCATLHMDIGLDDLDWCLDQVMPAHPAYLMALPTKVDPMLGYLTTGYQDHVRLRQRFGRRVETRMARFFEGLGVLDANGAPGPHFGDPLHVYVAYCRRRGDARNEAALRAEGRQAMDAVRARGVFLAEGFGATPGTLAPATDGAIRRIVADAKQALWATLDDAFIATIPGHIALATRAESREDYILHPVSGESLAPTSVARIETLANAHRERAQASARPRVLYDAQLVVSDGLNALAIREPGQLIPFLDALRRQLADAGWQVAPEVPVISAGRVRAGYRVGEQLFAGRSGRCALLHVVGERPGTGHNTFSVYLTAVDAADWARPGSVDHHVTRVVSGIAHTALRPVEAAAVVARVLGTPAGTRTNLGPDGM